LVHAGGEVDAVVQHGVKEFGKGRRIAGGGGGVIGHGLAGGFHEEEADHGADAIDGYGNVGFLGGGFEASGKRGATTFEFFVGVGLLENLQSGKAGAHRQRITAE